MHKIRERLDPWIEDIDEIQAFLHIQRYEYATKEINGMVLDVGCGLGYGSKMLHTVNSSVVALDISNIALSYAKKKYKGSIYVRADAQTLPFKDSSFDNVVAFEIIEHVDSGIHLLQEIHRILKSKGVLILSTCNIAHLMNRLKHIPFRKNLVTDQCKNPYHKYEYTHEELAKLLKSACFTIEKKWGQILPLPLVYKLPACLCVTTGRFLPWLSVHVVYKVRKN